MNALGRSPTVTFGRFGGSGYKTLSDDDLVCDGGDGVGSPALRAHSKRQKDSAAAMIASFSYRRRDRARRRRAFLQSYQLTSASAARRQSSEELHLKMKTVVVKVKSAAAAALATVRMGLCLGPPRSPSPACAHLPSPLVWRNKIF